VLAVNCLEAVIVVNASLTRLERAVYATGACEERGKAPSRD